MNSSLQCLSHTPIFREYFTSKAYLKDINTTNPLGHQGRLAQVSAVLINSLWKQFSQAGPHQLKRVTTPGSYALVNAASLTPKTFKDSIGKFNDHFQGNEQHDAQELLAFLLGGLSEDLNRIVDKPYIEAPDSDGRPDSELADIWWSNHLKREMSIIVAIFTGQYKSLLTCRSCKYESARFEPFSFLQLPLPEDDYLSVMLVLYPLRGGAETMKYCVRVRNDGKLREVLVALAKVIHEDNVGEASDAPPNVIKNKNGEESEDTDESKKEADEVLRISQGLAVVDMRDGYIFKIAPVSLAIPS
jgi:ubiquitin carboxyl-terminal hydrolase 6/32